ncbi:MAG: ATP-dependent DNA helicase RecG [bacterium]|nr:ATP-dependent DNA helicase RecG [bacterium]
MFFTSLSFQLTDAQKRVIQEVVTDLSKNFPMNRLVQGEVGSGKTVVAAAVIYLAHLNNLKSIIMAPTEILAFQHFDTLSRLLEPFGIKVGIYTGSRKRIQGDLPVIVGTHALLSKSLELNNVGLVVVDEQQRFGVEQRTLLRDKAESPHFLTMTATPIPRTVALTIYGDLDLSVIDQMPVGRKVVRTYFVPQSKRLDAYKFIENHIKEEEQAYIITPLIEESETQASAKAAKVEYERLQKQVFPKLRLGLLHGRLKSKEKEAAINAFKNHELDILVSTSVVEVGVDVPNATIMVIEGGERFGLAQLHQLRGRVGRGEQQSYAFLFTEEENPQVINRLKNLERIHDGLTLSELDLKIRGGGEVFGTAQSGRWNLKIASLSNLSLIEKTRAAAQKVLAQDPSLDKYPNLKRKLSSLAPEVSPD